MKKKRPFRFVYAFLALIFLALFWYWQNYSLQTVRYTISCDELPEGFDGFRIAHISDMHGIEFGHNNSTLVKRIKDFKPDIVVCTGDMISSSARDGQAFLNFLEGMGREYPIYMCLGNHEQIAQWYELESDADYGYQSFMDQVLASGVHILDNQIQVLEKDGDRMHISGLTLELYHYSRRDGDYADDNLLLQASYIEKALGLAGSTYTILLAHNPSYFKEYADWGANLVLSGHMHGGIIQVPFKGGLLSPEHVFFPEYDAGLFEQNGYHMIVNRGLGNSVINVRLFNRPELTEIILKSE